MKGKHLWKVMVLVALTAFLAEPALSAEPIKIGLMQGLSGPYEVYGKQEITGFKMGLEWATKGTNKILGRDVKLVIEDTQLKPARAKVGWSRLEAKSNDTRSPVVIGSAKFPRYIFAHAPSVVHYRIGGKYARFEALVGIDQRRHKKAGTVEFIVTNEKKYARGASAVRGGGRDRKTHPIWNRLKEDFPVARFQVRAAEEWLIRDGLAIDDGPESFKETAVAVLDQAQTILELIRKKDADSPTLAKWLGKFLSMVEKDAVAFHAASPCP